MALMLAINIICLLLYNKKSWLLRKHLVFLDIRLVGVTNQPTLFSFHVEFWCRMTNLCQGWLKNARNAIVDLFEGDINAFYFVKMDFLSC